MALLARHLRLLVSVHRCLKPSPTVKILAPSLPTGIPRPNVTSLGGGVQQPPSSSLQNFVPFRRPLSGDIYCQTLSIFCRLTSVTTKNISKWYFSALYVATTTYMVQTGEQFFTVWPWPLFYDLDLQSHSSQVQGWPSCQKLGQTVQTGECPQTNGRTHGRYQT